MSNSEARSRALAISQEPFQTVSERQGFFRGSGRSLADVWAHRELLWLLVKREIKARYKDSSLGLVWSLARPLIQLLIYYFAIGQILGAARNTPDFAIFVFTGLTTWGLFSEIVSGSTGSILGNGGLVKKVYLPREIFPLSTVGGAMFNFLVQLVVLLLAIVVLAHFPFGVNLLLAPLSVVMLVVFATAVGLVLSAINVYLRDTQHFVEIALLVLFWASPIVYPFTFVNQALHGNWLEQLYLANPVTIAIIGMQKALWAGGLEGTGATAQVWPSDLALRLVIMLVISTILLWISQRVFSRLQGNFAQEI
ncbi:ABC transporter permease [Leifsonia virtsii]|uniref:Transport permease protein n=1 Tax=Leifsonia virtsii TaxID=3035915 RepID=A0ABT8J2B5_9MICO|nr:ABC transporter permease [Leifsonia virtsii]MDN4598394.1 ABC transporter permease [Leifsonia virtsii]